MVLCIGLAPTPGQETRGEGLQPVPPGLAAFCAANATTRPVVLKAHQHQLVDDFSRLLQVAVNERLGLPDVDLGAEATGLLKEYVRLAREGLGNAGLEREAQHVMGLKERILERRGQLQSRAVNGWRSLAKTADPVERRIARARLKEVLARMQRFAEVHRDRAMQRFAGLFEIALTRLQTPRNRAEHEAREQSLARFTSLLEDHGLQTDERWFLAMMERTGLLMEREDLDAAAATVSRLREVARSAPFPIDQQARLLSLEIEVFVGRGFVHAANAATDRLHDLLPELAAAARSGHHKTLSAITGDLYRQVAIRKAAGGDHALACTLLETAATLPGLDLGLELRLRGSLAVERYAMGRLVEASSIARAVLQRLGRIAPDSPEARVVPALGMQLEVIRAECAARLGEVSVARQALHDAEAWAQGHEARIPREVRARFFLATALMAAAEGRLEEAIEKYDQVLAQVPTEPRPTSETIQSLWGLTRIRLLLGDLVAARRDALRARDAARFVVVDRDHFIFGSQLGLADVFLAEGRGQDALDVLNRVLADASTGRPHRPDLVARAQRLRASARWQIWRRLDRRDAGLTAIVEELIETLPGSEDRRRRGPQEVAEILQGYQLLHEIQLSRGQREAARTGAREALDLWKRSAPTEDASKVREVQAWNECRAIASLIEGREHEVEGRLEDAVRAYREAASLEDRLRSAMRFHAPEGLSRRFEGIHDRIAGLLLRWAAEPSAPERGREALHFLEKVRAQSLRSLLHAASARRRALWQERRASQVWAPAPMAPPRFDDATLRRLLSREDRGLLTYAITGQGAFVVALRGARIEVRKIAMGVRGLERQVESLGQMLAGRPSPYKRAAVLERARILYRELIAPVEDVVADASELVIIPDGVLDRLSFAVLLRDDVSPSGAGSDPADCRGLPFLATRPGLDSLAYAPSLATLALIERQPKARPDKDILVVGNPEITDRDLPPLTHATREITAIRSFFDPAGTESLLGSQATLTALSKKAPGRFGTLHFVTHAMALGRQQEETALLLSDDSRVGPEEAAALDLEETRVVVLSACRSGTGRRAGGEGVLGLPRSFLLAGARTVIAAFADVADAETSSMMTRFYEGRVKAGARPAAALLRAQKAMLDSPEASWPGYWAPFFVVGQP